MSIKVDLTPLRDDDPILPFGRFKGKRCSEVSVRYLDYIVDLAREPFKTNLLIHLASRPEYQDLEDGVDTLEGHDVWEWDQP